MFVKIVQSQSSATPDLVVPPTWPLYSWHRHAFGISGSSDEPHKGHIGKFATFIADKSASRSPTRILRVHVWVGLHTTFVMRGEL